MILFIFIIAFFCERFFILADTRAESMIYHSIGLHFLIIFIAFYLASTIPYQDIEKKIMAALFAIYRIFALSFFSYCQLTKNHDEITYSQNKFAADGILRAIQDSFIPLIIILSIYIVYVKLKRFNFKNSDYPNEKNILILLRYPKNIIGLILTILWKYPASTLSLYSGGFRYGFKRKTMTLLRCKIDHSELLSGKYFIIDTKIKKQDLSSYIGISWSLNRNCFNVFHPVIGNLRNYI